MEKDIILIERASEEVVKKLMDWGILYIGEDGQIHAVDKEA